jgi:hypothetical protein
MSGLVAIHQPNFFPWLGFFDKIRRADTFIFLDSVAYPRSGSGGMGSWTNRVRLKIQGEPRWVTCPVKRIPHGAPILAVEIDDRQPWRTKLLRTLQTNYGKEAKFPDTMRVLESLITAPETNLAAFNIHVIKTIAHHLGLSARFVHQSELPYEGEATSLLISLVKAVGGNAYLSGGGVEGYQEDKLFATCGVELVYQGFTPQPYGSLKSFLPGLSVIDYLMRDGRPLLETFPDLAPCPSDLFC